MSVTIKLRRGTSLEWTNSSPNVVLSLGEPGFETDTHKLKIGDGTTAWNSLDYVSDGFSGVGGPLDYTYEEDGDNNSFVANNPSGITNLKINPISHNVDFSPYYDDLIDNSYSINITLTKVEDADKAILFSCQNITDMTGGAHPYYSFDVAELSRSTLFTGFETDKKYYLNIDIKGQNFPELTEDKINSLIVAGSGIYKDYDDAADPATLTISVSGLNASYISDFSSAVSGLLPVQIASVDLHNGGVVTAQVLQFNDDSKQSVITGPTPPSGEDAQRIIVQGQRAQGGGEGGDVYVWGGDSDANGGDIKIYAGDADNVSPDSGYGGYVNIDGGKGASGGGDVEITGGYSAGGQAGDVIIVGGSTSSGVAGVVNINSNNGNWVFGADGGLTLPRGGIITDDIETVTLSGAGTVGVNQTYRKVAAGVYVGTTDYLYQIEAKEAPSTGYQVRLTTLSPPGYYESEDLITWTIVSGENGGVSPVPTGVVVPPNITLSVDSSSWAFGTDGTLTLPQGGVIDETLNVDTLTLVNAGLVAVNQTYIKTSPTLYTGSNGITIEAIGDGVWFCIQGGDTKYSSTDNLTTWDNSTGGLPVPTSTVNPGVDTVNITVGNETWTFGQDGNLILPASGSIGINTASPSGALHIINDDIALYIGDYSNTSFFNDYDFGGKVRVFADDDDIQVQGIKTVISKVGMPSGIYIGINGTSYTIGGGGSGTNVGLYGYAGNGLKNWGLWIDGGQSIFGDKVGIKNQNPAYDLDVTGSGNFSNSLYVGGVAVSVSGHSHTASNISDFSSSVSGLLPVVDVVQGSGINVTSSSGTFTVGVSGLNASYISDFSSSVSGLLPVVDVVQGSGVSVTSSSGTFTVSASGIASFTQLYPTVMNLGDVSSTISTDADTGQIFDVRLTGNVTLSNPTNPTNGVTLRWRIKQDGSGGRTVTLDSAFKIPSSATDPLPFSTAPDTIDLLAATYNSATNKWDIIAFVMGY